MAKRLTKPIAEMTEITAAISKGNYAARLKHLPKNELGVLGKSINRLAFDVEENISRREKWILFEDSLQLMSLMS